MPAWRLNSIPEVSRTASEPWNNLHIHTTTVELQMVASDVYVLLECLTTKQFSYR